MRKPKEQGEEEGAGTGAETAQFFDTDFESDDFANDQDDKSGEGDSREKKPARQRVELRSEQHALRRQLSDWDDYSQDDFDTKL